MIYCNFIRLIKIAFKFQLKVKKVQPNCVPEGSVRHDELTLNENIRCKVRFEGFLDRKSSKIT